MPVGDIALYQTYFAALVAKVASIVGLIPTIAKGAESVHSIGEILSSYDVEDYKGKQKLKQISGKFEFKSVDFHYADDDRPILRGLNLTVEAGETIALVGESGSGKTTILSLIAGLISPTGGEIKIDVAFIAAPTSDCMGNCTGKFGKSACGSLGYAF